MSSNYFFNVGKNFLPDQKVLSAWLSTNKEEMNNAGVTRPGLFNEPSISSTLGLLVILIFEIGTTMWIKSKGVTVAVIVIAIIVDLILAWASHLSQDKITKARNELLCYKKGQEIQIETHQRVLQRCTLWKNFFYCLILISAFGKGISFYLLLRKINIMVLGVIIIYLFAGVLHVYYTGYAFSYWAFRTRIYIQYSKFLNSNGMKYAYDKTQPRRCIIEMEASQTLTEVSSTKHAIVKDAQGNYFFEIRGILLDNEVSDLSSKQSTSEQQRIVAIEGVRLQLLQLTW